MVYLDWWFGCNVRACVSYDYIWSIKIFKSIIENMYCPWDFNINEPVIFGLPIVLNPILIIPFVITPLVTATIAYRNRNGICNTNAYYAAMDITCSNWCIFSNRWRLACDCISFINITISFLIYLPFFKMYDKICLKSKRMVTESRLILNLHAVILSDRLLSITSSH